MICAHATVRCLAAISLLFGPTLGCAAAPDTTQREASVTRAVERLIAADNSRDIHRVMLCYTDDVVWVPPDGEPLAGKEAIRPRYQALFSTYILDLTVEFDEVRADRELAFVRGRTGGKLTPLEGGAPKIVDDRFVALLRREPAGWRVSHLIWTPRTGAAAEGP
jgi:uncharacterized protein (TIGR02246 family)